MWRRCDLHTHTVPNEQDPAEWDPQAFIQSCVDVGLDVVAVTDHGHIAHVPDAITAAADGPVEIIAGIEVSTDRGDLLVLSPGPSGPTELERFIGRLAIGPGTQHPFDDVIRVREGEFASSLLLVGAHVDASGSLLGPTNTLALDRQIELASRLDALEVESGDRLAEWITGGVKHQASRSFALIQGSDRHSLDGGSGRHTWLYLPTLTVNAFRHTFAVPESSIRFGEAVEPPRMCIEQIAFEGGFHDGLVIDFCERTNALIGAPNVGKTFVIDALKFVFDLKSNIPEVDDLAVARMAACMDDGESVRVQVRSNGERTVISRTVGAAAVPENTWVPIIFSQTE